MITSVLSTHALRDELRNSTLLFGTSGVYALDVLPRTIRNAETALDMALREIITNSIHGRIRASKENAGDTPDRAARDIREMLSSSGFDMVFADTNVACELIETDDSAQHKWRLIAKAPAERRYKGASCSYFECERTFDVVRRDRAQSSGHSRR